MRGAHTPLPPTCHLLAAAPGCTADAAVCLLPQLLRNGAQTADHMPAGIKTSAHQHALWLQPAAVLAAHALPPAHVQTAAAGGGESPCTDSVLVHVDGELPASAGRLLCMGRGLCAPLRACFRLLAAGSCTGLLQFTECAPQTAPKPGCPMACFCHCLQHYMVRAHAEQQACQRYCLLRAASGGKPVTLAAADPHDAGGAGVQIPLHLNQPLWQAAGHRGPAQLWEVLGSVHLQQCCE